MASKTCTVIYNSRIANHYKSYRPPLHKVILETCLQSSDTYKLALDIGCGVGHSSEALLPFCQKIIGIDNSEPMLRLAPKDDNLIFEKSNLPHLSCATDSIDLITFAGSLFYCKSQELLNECLRVLNTKADILIYDFNIQLDEIRGFLLSRSLHSDYNHSINFTGLKIEKLSTVSSDDFSVTVDIELSNLIQLLLADETLYAALVQKFDADNLEEKLTKTLKRKYSQSSFTVKAELFYTMYKVS